MSSDLIGGYLTFYLNQPIKWADFRLDALLADTMLTKLYTTGPMLNNNPLPSNRRFSQIRTQIFFGYFFAFLFSLP
jgi:hypothetical protein